MDLLTTILLYAAGASLVMYGLAIGSTLRHRGLPKPEAAEALPPLSLLKPIKGTEEDLEENLRSFFEQEYPGEIEFVFASSEENDPGIEVARRVAADYPDVPAVFIGSDPDFGLNPKVANLAGALAAASHDLVLQSDANVRARPGYLASIVTEMVTAKGSLLSSMVTGVGEDAPIAAMENLQLSAYIGPATCTALHVAGVTCVIGKSMLFYRAELEELGGLEQVRDILCEDYILGERYGEAGRTVILSATAVENVNHRISMAQFLGRHSRWLKMQVVIHPVSFIATLFATPVPFGLLAWLTSGFDARVGLLFFGMVVVKILGDAFLVRVSRGAPMRLAFVALAPIKDVIMMGVWWYSAFSRSVTWRGKKLRFGKRTRLRPDDGKLPVRVARRLRDSAIGLNPSSEPPVAGDPSDQRAA